MRVKTAVGEMWLEDGILWHRVEEIVVSEEAALGIEAAVRQLTGGTPTPAIVDIRSIGYAGPEVRRLFAAFPADTGEIATALVVGNSASRTMASMFTKHSNPNRPIRVFTRVDEAAEWARSQAQVTED